MRAVKKPITGHARRAGLVRLSFAVYFYAKMAPDKGFEKIAGIPVKGRHAEP
jgi:hypothetical protein